MLDTFFNLIHQGSSNERKRKLKRRRTFLAHQYRDKELDSKEHSQLGYDNIPSVRSNSGFQVQNIDEINRFNQQNQLNFDQINKEVHLEGGDTLQMPTIQKPGEVSHRSRGSSRGVGSKSPEKKIDFKKNMADITENKKELQKLIQDYLYMRQRKDRQLIKRTGGSFKWRIKKTKKTLTSNQINHVDMIIEEYLGLHMIGQSVFKNEAHLPVQKKGENGNKEDLRAENIQFILQEQQQIAIESKDF